MGEMKTCESQRSPVMHAHSSVHDQSILYMDQDNSIWIESYGNLNCVGVDICTIIYLRIQARRMSLGKATFLLVPYALERANYARGKKTDIKFLISLVGELLLSPSTSSSCILLKYTPYPGTSSTLD